MYDKHIIVEGQSSTALTIIFVDAGTKLCASANKMDTNRVSTTRRNWKCCTEISPREIRTDLYEFTGLECISQTEVYFTIEYSQTYFSLQVDPGHRREQLKVLKQVGFRTRIAHISFTPS